VKEPSNFPDEEEIVRSAEELLASNAPQDIPWPSRDQDLPGSSRKVLSQAQLLDNIGGDVRLLAEVLSLFLTEAPKYVHNIRKAVVNHDAEALSAAAHKLKGTMVLLAAAPVSDIAVELERMGKDGNLRGAEELLKDLELQMNRLTEAADSLRCEYGQ
jgi:HPt (histidine-containing phosphotransfer) domain-containing protein